MMKTICVLLNGPIKNDHRVIKTILTLSSKFSIDLYYINGDNRDKSLFNKNVNLFSFNHKPSLLTRLIRHSAFWNEFNFFAKASNLQRNKYDFIWCNDLPTLNAGFRISKRMKCKLIYDSHEIYVETLNQFFPSNARGMKYIIFQISLGFMSFFGRIKEKSLMEKCDRIFTVNKSLSEYFAKKYNIKNVLVLMNFPPTLTLDKEKFVDFKERFNFSDSSKILLYQGVINKGRGLELLVRSMSKIDSVFRLVILGDGPLKGELVDDVKSRNLESKIRFIDKVPVHALLNYTSGADYGINLLENINLSKQLASPNKLYEYIHARVPVICSRTIENNKVLKDFNIGVLVENNVEDIAKQINNLIDKDVSFFKKECQRASSIFNWEKQEEMLINSMRFNNHD